MTEADVLPPPRQASSREGVLKSEGWKVSKFNSHWVVSPDGELAYSKLIRSDIKGAIDSLMAYRFAEKAGFSLPKIRFYSYRYQKSNPQYISVSPVLGEDQETIADFWSRDLCKPVNTEKAKAQVSESLSYNLALAKFLGWKDLHSKNIIVASWTGENGKKTYGTHFIDCEFLDYFARINPRWPFRKEKRDKHKTFHLDKEMYALGVEAIKNNITDEDIESIVDGVFKYFSYNDSRYKESIIRRLKLSRRTLIAKQDFKSAGRKILGLNRQSKRPPESIPAYNKVNSL